MFTLFVIMLWVIIIGALIGAVIKGIKALPTVAKEEQFRQQKEKEYYASIEKWKEIDIEMYKTLADINPFDYKTYYAQPKEYRPKDIPQNE
ncbi:hypothetical protein [Anaerovibrio sp.]|uniref:hypothetical protein n=1 Tax=Anaerovibrio sp. TaxID=1872532 RepID=UPI00388E30F0